MEQCFIVERLPGYSKNRPTALWARAAGFAGIEISVSEFRLRGSRKARASGGGLRVYDVVACTRL